MNCCLRGRSSFVIVWRANRPPTFKEAIEAGYAEVIRPQHSWVVRQTFSLAISVVPTWEEAGRRLAKFDADGEAGVVLGAAALDIACERVAAALRRRDMWDTRRI